METERDAIIAALTSVVDGIAATFGPVCEVVLHDYRKPESSVVAIAGSVTGRTVGGAMSEIGMRMLARGDEAADELNYVTRTETGKLVKSSTMLLRDSSGAVFGALCVNVDVTAATEVHALLGALAGTVPTPRNRPSPPSATTSTPWSTSCSTRTGISRGRSSTAPGAWTCSAAWTNGACSRSGGRSSRWRDGSGSPVPPPTAICPSPGNRRTPEGTRDDPGGRS